MSENPPPSWTPIEAEQLHNVDFIAEVLRRSAVAKSSETPKPRWQRFLESTGGAALITVLIGGVVGGIITGLFQYWQKERETEQAILKSRTDQALLAYKEYLEKRQEVNKMSYEILAECISTSDNLIDAFTRSDFDPKNRPKKSQVEASKIQEDAKKAYDGARDKWQKQAELIGLLLAQYHDSNPDVATKWAEVKTSIDRYLKCAEACFLAGKSGCGCSESTKSQLENKLTNFQAAVAKSRDFLWKQTTAGQK